MSFKVDKVISAVAYRLQLPPHWTIHPTFHVSKLKAFNRLSDDDEREVEPPEGELVDGTIEYEVERILRDRGTPNRREYLILWKGFDLMEATWEPEAHLANASDILAEYLRNRTTLPTKEEIRSERTKRRTRRRQQTL